jgi:hypothetical protein
MTTRALSRPLSTRAKHHHRGRVFTGEIENLQIRML